MLLLVVSAADVAGPWPLKVIVDNVLRGDPHGLSLHMLRGPRVLVAPETILALALLALLIIVAVGAVANYLGTFLLNAAGERMMADLRGALFAHMQRLSLTYYDQQRVGDLTARVTGDVENVQDLLASRSRLRPTAHLAAGGADDRAGPGPPRRELRRVTLKALRRGRAPRPAASVP